MKQGDVKAGSGRGRGLERPTQAPAIGIDLSGLRNDSSTHFSVSMLDWCVSGRPVRIISCFCSIFFLNSSHVK